MIQVKIFQSRQQIFFVQVSLIYLVRDLCKKYFFTVISEFDLPDDTDIILQDRDGIRISVDDLDVIINQFCNSACFFIEIQVNEAVALHRANAVIGPDLIVNSGVNLYINQ